MRDPTFSMQGPTFSTPDVLPTGQTGWDLDLAERVAVRRLYRVLRRKGYRRGPVQVHVALTLWKAS